MKTTREKRRAQHREQSTAFSHYMSVCGQFYAELFDPSFDHLTYQDIYTRYCKKWSRIAAMLNEKLVTGTVATDMFQKEFCPLV